MTTSFALEQGASAAHRYAAQDAYHNVNQLAQLGAMSANDADAALEEVSNQFESMLVQQMLKSMRQANQVWSEDGLFNSQTVSFYQQMLDDQLSVELGGRGTLGFADAVEQQLMSMKGASANGSAIAASQVLLKNEPSTQPTMNSASVEKNHRSESAFSALAFIEDKAELNTNSPDEFVESLLPYARQAAERLGVPAEKIIAQAALETGWGKHIMQGADGSSSYNLFGIKADERWQGDRVVKTTQEFFGGRELTVNASFRSYQSLEQAFNDYVDFLQSNPRYGNVLNSSSDFALNLQRAGYATDPAYAQKIEGIASQLIRNEQSGSAQ